MDKLNKDIVSIYIYKTILKKNCFIKQIAVVFLKDNKFKYVVKYIKNDFTNSFKAISLEDALKTLYEKIKDKHIILFNDDNNDYMFLKEKFKSLININFSNIVYDVSLLAKKMNIKKYNLINLANIYKCYIANTSHLPKSVNLAQNLYMVGIKMFLL